MQLDTLFHTSHLELVGLGILLYFSVLLGLLLQVEQLLGVRHLQALATHIVLIGQVIDTADVAAAHLARFCPVVVESGTVGPTLKGHIVAEVVTGGILHALHQPVVESAPQVVSLLPRHVANLTHGT